MKKRVFKIIVIIAWHVMLGGTALWCLTAAQQHTPEPGALADHAGHAGHVDHENHASHVHAPVDAHDHTDHTDHTGHAGHEHDHDHASHAGHEHAPVDAHDHTDHTDHTGHASHAGHTHAEHGHDHADADVVVLSEAQKRTTGPTLQKAGPGKLFTEITLPGEIGINEDASVHIVPRVSGIALKVLRSVGDTVRQGEILAIIDSPELGEAKSSFFEVLNEVECNQIDLRRAQEIESGVTALLQQLRQNPSLATLNSRNYSHTGEHGAKLLTTYAELLLNQSIFTRKQALFKENLASENDLLQAQAALEKVHADYVVSRDTASFYVRQQRLERERAQRVSMFRLKTAERKLRIFGLPEAEIQRLAESANIDLKNPPATICTEEYCDWQRSEQTTTRSATQTATRPTTATGRHQHQFTEFFITAPQSGTIVARRAAVGERITTENDIFTLVDLNTVWVNFRVSARDLPLLHEGMSVLFEADHGANSSGIISKILPLMNQDTRTVTVRAVIANPTGVWRPGIFVTGTIRIVAEHVPVVVPRSAVQNIAGRNVVFVPHGEGFKAITVQPGRGDRDNLEIVSGLTVGSTYVERGAFTLKAVNVTSGVDAHAGHGH